MDTIKGIPALIDTDPASLIGQYSRDLRTALLGTTGAITPASGWAYNDPAPALKRQGNIVEASGRLQPNASTVITTSFTQIGTMPSSWAPPAQRGTVTTSAAGFLELVITAGGAISIRVRSGSLTIPAEGYVHLDTLWFI